jgi:L-amino acid N-acyltransferase YncA
MPLTGAPCRQKTLSDACGKVHCITIVQPAATADNKRVLLATEKLWRAYQRTQPVEQWMRSRLAIDTAFIAANALPRQGTERADYHILVAQDEAGEVRGIATFDYFVERQAWELFLLTVSPQDQGGSLERCQIRGIGSELLGATLDVMTAKHCTAVELSPLDEKARGFWERRGFRLTGDDPSKPWVMQCPAMQAFAMRYAQSPTDDEDLLVDDLTRRQHVSIEARALSAARRRAMLGEAR